MKNTGILKNLSHAVLLNILLFSLAPASAAPIPPMIGGGGMPGTDKNLLAITPCQSDADCSANGYGVSLRALLFQPTYKQAQTIANGSILNFILSPGNLIQSTLTSSKAAQSVVTLVSNTGNTADQLLASTPEFFAENIVLSPNNSSISTSPSAVDIQNAINTMNFESVVGPMSYQSSNGNSSQVNSNSPLVADTFIKYVSDLANPFRPANFATVQLPSDNKYSSIPAYLIDLQKRVEVRDYLTAMRNYAAQLSVGISNFYYLYNERMPITDPTMQNTATAIMSQVAASSGQPVPSGSVSPLQMQQFIATSRVSDPNWYINMQNATPSTLLREMLFTIAHIPPMLFQLHLDLERILATMSTMQMQQTNGGRLMLTQQRDAVDKILSSPAETKTNTDKAVDEANNQANKADIENAKKALLDSDSSNSSNSN